MFEIVAVLVFWFGFLAGSVIGRLRASREYLARLDALREFDALGRAAVAEERARRRGGR